MFILLISNHTVFLVQFRINLHLWVFQKAEIALAEAARAISTFWKTHSCKLIPNWTRNRMITYTYNVKRFKTNITSFAKEKKNYKENINNYKRQKDWKVNGLDQGKSLGKKKPRGTAFSNLDFQRLKIRIRRLVKYTACGQAYIWNLPANYIAIINSAWSILCHFFWNLFWESVTVDICFSVSKLYFSCCAYSLIDGKMFLNLQQ